MFQVRLVYIRVSVCELFNIKTTSTIHINTAMTSKEITDSDFNILFDFDKMDSDDRLTFDFDNWDPEDQRFPDLLSAESSSEDSRFDSATSGTSSSLCIDPALLEVSTMQSSSEPTISSAVPSLPEVGSYQPVVDGPDEPLFAARQLDPRDQDPGYHKFFGLPCETATGSHVQHAWAYHPVGVPHPSLPPGYILRGDYTVSKDQSDCPPGHIMVEGLLTKLDSGCVKRRREKERVRQEDYRERKRMEKLNEEQRPGSRR